MKLRVEGMSCGHCVEAVRKAVLAACPEARVEVDLERGIVTVEGAGDRGAVVRAIRDAGYEAGETAAGGTSPD